MTERRPSESWTKMNGTITKAKSLNSQRGDLLNRLEIYDQCETRFSLKPWEIKKIRLVPVDSITREVGSGWRQAVIYSSEVTMSSGKTIKVDRVNVKHFIETGKDQDMTGLNPSEN